MPAAILLERGWEDGGRIFISDFGITRHVASSTRLTRTGSFAGSVDYVARRRSAVRAMWTGEPTFTRSDASCITA